MVTVLFYVWRSLSCFLLDFCLCNTVAFSSMVELVPGLIGSTNGVIVVSVAYRVYSIIRSTWKYLMHAVIISRVHFFCRALGLSC